METVKWSVDEELGEQASCCICLENFVDGESLVVMPCSGRHAFHAEVMVACTVFGCTRAFALGLLLVIRVFVNFLVANAIFFSIVTTPSLVHPNAVLQQLSKTLHTHTHTDLHAVACPQCIKNWLLNHSTKCPL